MAQESWKVDKEETGCQPPEGPVLCVNNCGFFGSATTMNLCSKCYRDVVLNTKPCKDSTATPTVQNEQPEAERHPRHQPSVAAAGSSSSQLVGTITGSSDVSEQPVRQPPNRCHTCNKRVGLTGFKCRCGDVFCSLHRYSDKHNCRFDYKTAARDAIASANPVIKADKIEKI